MNSWFWYEFMVCSMGSISANVANNQVKIDYACRSWCWGAVFLWPADKSHGALVSVSFRASAIGFSALFLCGVICVLARKKLAKAS